MTKVRIDKLVSNLGYSSRRAVANLIKEGVILENGKEVAKPDQKVVPEHVTLYGEALDPFEILVMFHKPVGYLCSHTGDQPLIYELLPERWSLRNPVVTSVGRLDFDTSGLLILTDNGQLIHRLTSPKFKVPKVYEVTLENDLKGNEAELFSSGNMIIEDEVTPLLPAELKIINSKLVHLTLFEGRYHQVKKMFQYTGNQVVKLHRIQVGKLVLGDLAESEYRNINIEEI